MGLPFSKSGAMSSLMPPAPSFLMWVTASESLQRGAGRTGNASLYRQAEMNQIFQISEEKREKHNLLKQSLSWIIQESTAHLSCAQDPSSLCDAGWTSSRLHGIPPLGAWFLRNHSAKIKQVLGSKLPLSRKAKECPMDYIVCQTHWTCLWISAFAQSFCFHLIFITLMQGLRPPWANRSWQEPWDL